MAVEQQNSETNAELADAGVAMDVDTLGGRSRCSYADILLCHMLAVLRITRKFETCRQHLAMQMTAAYCASNSIISNHFSHSL